MIAALPGNKAALRSTPEKLHCCLLQEGKKIANFIFALINSKGLLWSPRVRSTCVPIHFLKVCCKKASLLRCSPHVGRLHLLFITSWLYFSSKFQAGVQSAKKASLCSLYVCGLLLFLFVRMQIKA